MTTVSNRDNFHGDFLNFLQPQAGSKFQQHFKMSLAHYFAAHGYAIRFNENADNIHKLWLAQAREWSLTIKLRNDIDRVGPKPDRLSHIKHAGILLWASYKLQPIACVTNLTDAQKETFEDAGIKTSTRTNELLLKYPNEMACYAYVAGCFNNRQSLRHGKALIDFRNPPRSDHYMENFCVFLRKGSYTQEALYMIFKTMDLYGFIPDKRDDFIVV